MSVSEAQIRANHKYRAKTYDQIQVQVKKGKRDEYRAQAAARGLSLNAYIIALLEADKAQVKAASSLPDAPEGTDNAP